MTITTSNSQQIFLGDNVTTAFTTNFIPDSASNLVLTLSTSSAIGVVIAAGLYSVSIPPPPVGEIWPTSATITYPLTGPPISTGTYLTVSRVLPFTQPTAFGNQGNLYPQSVEAGLDILEMQMQQLSSRTTQFRGIWATNTNYNVGDIVQDGANGAGTNNYYICQTTNLSGVWATDFLAGDWAISVIATVPSSGNQPITLSGAVTGVGATAIITTIPANSITNAKLATVPALTIKGNNGSSTATPLDLTVAQLTTMLNLGGVTSVTGDGTIFSNSGSTGTVTLTLKSGTTGTGKVVLANSAILTSPTLGTPLSGNLANCSGFPQQLMTALGVGCIVLASASLAVSAGVTTAGSNLQINQYNTDGSSSGANATGDTASGTWQALQFYTGASTFNIGLWQRTV